MATSTLGNLTTTAAWQDITATYGTAASANVLIQNADSEVVQIVFGGASAPSGKSGITLDTYDSVQGNAANIWVRGSGTISILLA